MDCPATLWDRVDELVAQAPSLEALRFHRLDLLAANLRRRTGRAVDASLRASERQHALGSLAAPHILRRVRSLVDGPLVLMKGPEVAASYAHPECRRFNDLDILTCDLEQAQRALLRAGFVEISGKDATPYHARPLVLPGLPLVIELHSAPHFAAGLSAPPLDALLPLTRPSRTGVDGVRGLAPAPHAVILAVHGWAHEPLERLGLMIDVAAVLAEGDRDAADKLAESWGCSRLWRATLACVEALFLHRTRPIPMRTWARHLGQCGVPSLIDSYIARLAAPAWALPRLAAMRRTGAEVRRTAFPCDDETWMQHLFLSRRALVHARAPLSQYRSSTNRSSEGVTDDPAFARA